MPRRGISLVRGEKPTASRFASLFNATNRKGNANDSHETHQEALEGQLHRRPRRSGGRCTGGGLHACRFADPHRSGGGHLRVADRHGRRVAGDSKGTKVEVQTSYLALIAGLTQFYQPGDVFSLAEGDLTRDEIIAKLHGFVSEVESTKAANQAWRAQVQVERSTLLEVRPLREGLKGIVGAKFGKGSPQLVSFGFQPLKATVKSTGSKAAAVAKAEATRKARGTKGSAQKQDITGNVTGVVITPMVAGPAVPAAPPAPKGGGASPQGPAAAGSGS